MNKPNCAVNNWVINRPSGAIQHIVSGEQKRLGANQLKLLEILQQNAGKILTREELTEQVWERRSVSNNSLPNAIHTLRAALEDDGKQQRIIRTIPKHGYVLDAEFCRNLDDEAQAPQLPEPVAEEVTPPTLPVPLAAPPQEEQNLPSRISCARALLLALVIVLSMTCSWYMAVNRNSVIAPKEMAKNIYSQLRIFALHDPGESMKEQTAIYDRLKDSYYILNQELNKKALRMSIYYHSENQILNYTLRVHNACEQKVLSMQIDHWRADTALLNKLILSESRRKMDEMAPCKTQ